MTAIVVVLVSVGSLALVASGVRWLRVAQREHYIAGSCLRAATRWVARRPPNGVAAVGAGVATVVAVVALAGGAKALGASAAALALAAAAVLPIGMPILGKPRLHMTRRATTLAAVAALLAALVWLVAGLLSGVLAGVVVAAVAMPALVDAAQALVVPGEKMAAERHRRRAAARLERIAPFVVAITGSWGKTSTKNHVRHLLTGSVEVVASPASWNNTAGLSRTVNEHLSENAEVFVAEMGMYGPGEIRRMCSWIRPDVAVICAIGPMHLERVGSIEGIVEAKSEILERARSAVLWVDEPHLAALADRSDIQGLWRVGRRDGASAAGLDVSVAVDTDSGEISVWLGDQHLGNAPGASGLHAGNVGCAVAAALASGATAAQVASRVGSLASPDHRATIGYSAKGALVIDDTFNSNPVGARRSVAELGRMVDGERVVVTPGMIELGASQESENRALADAVIASGARLMVVGWTNRRALVAGATEAGADRSQVVVVPSRTEAAAWVRERLGEGDGVLWENDLPDHYP